MREITKGFQSKQKQTYTFIYCNKLQHQRQRWSEIIHNTIEPSVSEINLKARALMIRTQNSRADWKLTRGPRR